MKKLNCLILIVLLAALFNACKKENSGNDPSPKPPNPSGEEMILPKKQMRAAWMATAWGLDWPQEDYNAATQKQQYISYLEKFKQLNMNAVFVQVKGMGDAFYNSPYEPWSVAITGTRGKDPGYDVLKFMIDEAHAKGIEFHAWLNPYRIATRAGTSSYYPALHSSVKPEWVVSHEKIQIYNPAIPEVRQRLADIVKDIITKYEVDGIHFDDYFYPDPSTAGQMVSDQNDYLTYKTGTETIEQFRRSNVDKAIKGVRDVIVATKPEVVFSVSPASDFTYNLNTMYADIKKWAAEGWMDVVIPQLYSNSNFSTKLGEWDIFNNKPHLMIGHGYYVMNSSSDLSNQFSLIKNKKAVVGSLLYSAKYLNSKPDITNKLAELWSDPAVIPFLGRAVAPAPADPQNVRLEGNVLKWNTSGPVRSVVYFTTDIKKEAKVLTITSASQVDAVETGFYSVSTLNADNKESAVSKTIKK
ncbi:glycoside hydrolase family 10 protein [Niabella aquatica]